MSFTKTEEAYIEHEVKLRVHDTQFQTLEKSIEKLDLSIKHLDNKFDLSAKHLDNKFDLAVKHLDNKFMLMFGIILGSIWLPAILHYLHIT